jgi:hypothetical protein
MISRHSQGKTNSPPAVIPIGMQLTPDGLGGVGWFICATRWPWVASPALAWPIAAAENINTKAVFFIGCLQLGGSVAATRRMARLARCGHHNYDVAMSFVGRNREPVPAGRCARSAVTSAPQSLD